MLRRSRALYACEFLEPGQEVDPREASIFARETLQIAAKGSHTGRGNVAFTISAALVRYPEHSTTRRVILEKAQVVVRSATYKEMKERRGWEIDGLRSDVLRRSDL
jgi:hypothetical protein